MPADLGGDLVPEPGTAVAQHVRAGLGHREEQVGHALRVDSEPVKGFAEHAPDDGDADGLAGKHQAEPSVNGRLFGSCHPRAHPLLYSPVPQVILTTL